MLGRLGRMKRQVMGTVLLWALSALALSAAVFQLEQEIEPTGLTYPQADGTTLNLRLVEQQWHLLRLDAEDKVVPINEDRAIIRIVHFRDREEDYRILLRPEGASLTSPRRVFAPFDYWVTLILPRDEAESVVLGRKRFRG